ncbi:MAG: helix-turn-helix domain-containing protein [Ignavibacteria bacterium]|nr:helix-turn-helix domain-containing protein [Ignavibacteria bacterium]
MADNVKTFAEDLKAVREENNLTLKSISQQTRLNMSILENLENGDFAFQPQAYIRAFLKQYINCLGLDLEETLFDYDLARSGKYKPKRVKANISTEVVPDKEESPEVRSTKSKITEKIKGLVDAPKKTDEANKTETDAGNDSGKISTEKKDTAELTIQPKNESKTTPDKNYNFTQPVKEKNKISLSFLSSPLVRNIFLIIFALLVLLGLYSIVNILFLEGSNDRPEVIRQNFDDVVNEQEQKILGKRTPEEIQDSIKKAETELSLAKDSITLKITGLGTGVLYLVTDSVNYNSPQRVRFEKNDELTFKAGKLFFISSEKTGSFKAAVNDVPIKFSKPEVSKIKITKNGIAN